MGFPLLPALILLLAVVSPLASSATILPRQSKVTLTSFSYAGTACSAGSVSSTINRNGSIITFGFDLFQTYYGPSYPVAERYKNCILYLRLGYPLGSKFEIVGVTYRGQARLDAGMNATIETKYLISSPGAADGSTVTRVRSTSELVGEYTSTDTIPTESRTASHCGLEEAYVQIRTRVKLTATSTSVSGSAYDESPFSLDYQQLHLGWSVCQD
ncbi:hypothetical protein N657DRAFT_649854 [Parathielavia appendiculata]|uniref:Secreted protein n=1 Tax=Parathielavia appendiculata TaxID=2587402 RepID=A0AAN6YZV2_9PEZI|nr:hypothetical protein N657DRAFT_649854 [Parathielavia appendiculata]